MTQSFDEWWEDKYFTLSADIDEAKEIYETGAQSRQAEVDELQKKYDAMYNAFVVADNCRKEWHESYMSVRKGRDELKARIDELQKHSLMLREAAKSWSYNEREKSILISQADDLDRILKGNKNEN